MYKIEEKITKFEKNCLRNAKMDAEEIEKKINKEIEEEITDEILRYKKEAEEKLNRKILKLEKEYNVQVFEMNNNLKKELLQEEIMLKNDIYEEAKKQIIEFTVSEEYEKYLFNTIRELINESNENFYITERDFELFEKKIKNQFQNIRLFTINNKYIGGCICEVPEDKMRIDNTLLNYLNEKIKLGDVHIE